LRIEQCEKEGIQGPTKESLQPVGDFSKTINSDEDYDFRVQKPIKEEFSENESFNSDSDLEDD
jgi:hypothetical protein